MERDREMEQKQKLNTLHTDGPHRWALMQCYRCHCLHTHSALVACSAGCRRELSGGGGGGGGGSVGRGDTHRRVASCEGGLHL